MHAHLVLGCLVDASPVKPSEPYDIPSLHKPDHYFVGVALFTPTYTNSYSVGTPDTTYYAESFCVPGKGIVTLAAVDHYVRLASTYTAGAVYIPYGA